MAGHNKKEKDFHKGIFVNFHQRLVVYYILDYFGILFILDMNSGLIDLILWEQRLSKGFVLRNILRVYGTYK